MSFLDSLENNLKALENMDPGGIDDSKRRNEERNRALAEAPWAARLKDGPFVKTLMGSVTRAGFSRRIKVNFVWIGTTLRLEALEQRLELQPTLKRVEAVFAGQRIPVNLDGSPDALIATWMKILDRVHAERKAENEKAEREAALELGGDED